MQWFLPTKLISNLSAVNFVNITTQSFCQWCSISSYNFPKVGVRI